MNLESDKAGLTNHISPIVKDFKTAHEQLIEEIASRMNDDENERYVISDGVHSPELYFANPLRIAWMLKEPYDDEDGIGGGWSLLKMFDYENQYAKFSEGHRTTWHPIIYVTYALKNGFMKYGDMDYIRDDHSMIEVLKSTAFINAQKLPSKNVTTTHFNDLHESLEKYHDLLIRQINLIDPNVLIFANTFQVYRNYLGLQEITPERHGTIDYIFHKGKLYIHAYHPAQRTVKGFRYTDDIVTVVEKFYDQLV